jgi:hypothetical protein
MAVGLCSAVMAAAVLLLIATAGQAQTINYQFPFTATINVPCANGGAGEDILIAGVWHSQVGGQLDQNGKLHLLWRDKLTGKAVGLTSGDEFKFAYSDIWHYENYMPGGTIRVYRDVELLRLVGKADAPNLDMLMLVRHVINANGEMTVEIERIDPLCP